MQMQQKTMTVYNRKKSKGLPNGDH